MLLSKDSTSESCIWLPPLCGPVVTQRTPHGFHGGEGKHEASNCNELALFPAPPFSLPKNKLMHGFCLFKDGGKMRRMGEQQNNICGRKHTELNVGVVHSF